MFRVRLSYEHSGRKGKIGNISRGRLELGEQVRRG